MELWINLILPLAGLLFATIVAAFIAWRVTSDINKASLMGGSVFPAAFLIETIYWLGWDMAVDDPPPSMILLGLPFGILFLWMLFYWLCYGVLRLSLLIE